MSPRALPIRPARRWMVAGARCLAAPLSACGDDQEGGPASSSSVTAEATTTTAAEVRYDPAALSPCGVAQSYWTLPNWLPRTVPDGLALQYAATQVSTSAGNAPGRVETEVTLVEADGDGRVVAELSLHRHALDGFEIEPTEMAEFDTHEEAGRLDSVRGHPGRVVRSGLNRGDPWGRSNAWWIEDGAGWSASSRLLDVQSLAAALEPLRLEPEEQADPSGRFQVIGRTTGDYRERIRATELGFGLAASSRRDDTEVVVTVNAVPEGTEGVVSIDDLIRWSAPDGPQTHLSEVQGRVQVSNGHLTVTGLEDGTQVAVRGRLVPVSAMDGEELEPQLSEGDLQALVDGLERVTPSDDRLPTVPLSRGWDQQPEADRTAMYCRET